eukprot:TRINITY_DN16079_c0_g1_i3.p2 TRINITY_DN16079_c0_g1~~TRINITY_DN16079_c0_g1_i3.p2  ORF type:complete len:104 (-),score=32.28 TRINITY_DN16079_c0_g1_i3:219-530(-)
MFFFFFFSSRRRHTRCREVSWARRCVQETGTWGYIIKESLRFRLIEESEGFQRRTTNKANFFSAVHVIQISVLELPLDGKGQVSQPQKQAGKAKLEGAAMYIL